MRSQPPLETFEQITHHCGHLDARTMYSGSYAGRLVSFGNKRRKGGSYESSGNFYVVKNRVSAQSGPLYSQPEGFGGPWVGHLGGPELLEAPFRKHDFESSEIAFGRMKDKYATGWARARPDRERASVGQFIGELRDLPQIPKLLYNRLISFRNLGKDYLNLQFGWKPFIDDLRKMYDLNKKIDSMIAQMYRENHKVIRRRATIENEQTTSSNLDPGPYGVPFHGLSTFPSIWATGDSTYDHFSTRRKRMWFVGKYQYHIPDMPTSEWTSRAKRALFGANLTPKLAWELMPWSWLFDWWGTVGDVIANISPGPLDGLTTVESYTMYESVATDIYHAQGWWQPNVMTEFSCNSGSYDLTTVKQIEQKARVVGGNPFGVTFDTGTLTMYQASILAALGFSKGPKALFGRGITRPAILVRR